MSRPKPMSGFPEFLPAERMVELHALRILSSTFELHGFAPIETRAVEPLDQLARKGEIEKEIYAAVGINQDEVVAIPEVDEDISGLDPDGPALLA